MTTWTVLGTLAVALITASGGYFVARLTRSGRVDTTPAETLWAASERLREEYRAELAALRAEVAALRADSVADRAEIKTLTERVRVLQAEVEEYRHREAGRG